MTTDIILPSAEAMKTVAIDARRAKLTGDVATLKQTIFDAVESAAHAGLVTVTLRFDPIPWEAANDLSDWAAGHGYKVSNISTIKALDMIHGFEIDWSGK